MSKDIIYREDAIKAINLRVRIPHDIASAQYASMAINAICSVPSADRPQGEWIHNPNGIDRDFIWWKCSKCGHVIYSESEHDREEFHAFCGRCGARMKGADDERDS